MSAIEIILTDSTGSLTIPDLEVPLIESLIENAVDVETLSRDVYTDFISNGNKRVWSHSWDSIPKELYDALRGYYDRQWTLFQYPTFAIPFYGIADVPVRMTINQKNIYNNCGDVQDVQASWRETAQLPVTS